MAEDSSVGKIARIKLSSSNRQLGGGPFGRVARQAIREHAESTATNRMIIDALIEADLDAMPDERESFVVFFRGPLMRQVREKLGDGIAERISDHVERGLSKVRVPDSGVQPLDDYDGPMRIVLVGVDDARADAISAEIGDHQLMRASDVLEVLGMVTERAPMAVVLDASVQLIAAAVRTLGKVLPGGARVLQWGGEVVMDRPTDLVWERLAPHASPEEVARRCTRGVERAERAGPSILLVGPEPSWRASVAGRLRAEGYTVIETREGAAALELCDQRGFGLVICARGLPDLDGAQLGALVRQRLEAKAPPVLLVSEERIDVRDLAGVVASVVRSPDLTLLVKRVKRLAQTP